MKFILNEEEKRDILDMHDKVRKEKITENDEYVIDKKYVDGTKLKASQNFWDTIKKEEIAENRMDEERLGL